MYLPLIQFQWYQLYNQNHQLLEQIATSTHHHRRSFESVLHTYYKMLANEIMWLEYSHVMIVQIMASCRCHTNLSVIILWMQNYQYYFAVNADCIVHQTVCLLKKYASAIKVSHYYQIPLIYRISFLISAGQVFLAEW